MKNLLFTFLFILFFAAFHCHSQNTPIEGIDSNELSKLSDVGLAKKYFVFDNRYEGVKGSLYYNENWKPGNFKLTNGKEYKLNKIKYNVYQELIEFTTAKNIPYSISTDDLVKLVLKEEDGEQVFKKMIIPGEKEPSLVREVVSGNISLYEYPQIIFREANYKGAFPSGNPFDEFIKSGKYYISRGDGKLEKLRMKRKSVKKIFKGEELDKMKNYTKVNNLDLRNSEGWVKLLEHYNSM